MSKEEFVVAVKNIREMLQTDTCAECSCPNLRCEWHGDCYNCIRIYRHFGRHVPRCLQFVLDKKIASITEAARNEGQKKPLPPDEYFDYLNAVAPKEDA
ncbi:MAG: hypothetical protein V1806_16420 [Pseudomonadota bacterium]